MKRFAADAHQLSWRRSRCDGVRVRGGLSTIDVLVVAAIVLLLSTTLFPALQMARESARRRTCQANLRQIGAALQSYHDDYRCLPRAAVWSAEGSDVSRFTKIDDTLPLTHENWVICLLPLLVEGSTAFDFDVSFPIMAPRNATARQSDFRLFRCPADTYNRSDNPYVYEAADGSKVAFARGNYAINEGSHSIFGRPGSIRSPLPDGFSLSFDVKSRTFQWWGIGVAGINKSFSLDEFTNGLSTTVVVDEVRAGIHPMDPRGVWALGQFGSSITRAHGIGGDAGGPNPKLAQADDIFRGKELHPILGAERIAAVGMTFCDHCTKSEQASSRSQHPGGVNVLMADGTVRFIDDDIHPGVWHLMHSRETPPGILAGLIDQPPRGDDRREAPAPQPSDNPNPASRNVDPPPEVLVNSLSMRFKRIPAGTFVMGLADEGNALSLPEECPAHHVTISRPFFIGVFEVTQEQFESTMKSNPSWFAPGAGGVSELAIKDTKNCPVENVTWDEAVDFCRRLGKRAEELKAGRTYRLPTEAEWEYCCRSGSTRPFDFVSNWMPNDNSGEYGGKEWTDQPLHITPVGSYAPNAFGIYDMRGNVWEWCNDFFARDYYRWSSSSDPQGPLTGFHKVFRGTDWIFTGDGCKTRSLTAAPWQRNPFIGFRVVCCVRRPSFLAR